MKRKFLILSAALLTVCGAALLQSCSSEYEYYDTTSEYGYYTEEEIAAIEALAEMYGLSIDFNEDYNGVKHSLRDIEDEMIGLASLLGEYEMVHEKDTEGKTICVSRIKELGNRTITRAVEGKGEWSGSRESTCRNFSASVTISWDTSQSQNSKKVSGNAKLYVINMSGVSESVGEGKLTCSFSGDNGINFSGDLKGERTVEHYDKGTSTLFKYKFLIVHGTVNTSNKTGAFDISAHCTDSTTR